MEEVNWGRTNQHTHDSARLDPPLPLHLHSTPDLASHWFSSSFTFSSLLLSPAPSLAPFFLFVVCCVFVLFFLFLFRLFVLFVWD